MRPTSFNTRYAEHELKCLFDKTMIKIRNVTENDLTDLLWDKNFKKLKKYEEKNFQSFLDGELLWLVAYEDEPIGQIKAKIKNEAIIFALRVYPKEQGKGIGSKLILEMEKLLKKKGFFEVFISVHVDNPQAQKLYERLGYKIIKQDVIEEWEYADDAGEICMMNMNVNRLKKKL